MGTKKAKQKKQVRKKTVKRKARKVTTKTTEQERTLGDIRQALESWIDEHVVTDINKSGFPELVNLYSYMKGAFLRAVEIVKGCKAGLDVELFVQIYTDLDIFLNRAMELERDEPGLLQSWPENRGLTFSKTAFYGCSALNIATKYSLAVMHTIQNARAETLGINKKVWTKIVVSPEPDSRILMWRDLAVQEIIDRIIPPGWEMYEINGEHGKIDDIMNGEFEGAIKEAKAKLEDKNKKGDRNNKPPGEKINIEDRFSFAPGQVRFDDKDLKLSTGLTVDVFVKLFEKFGQTCRYEELYSERSQLKRAIGQIRKTLKKRKIPCEIVTKTNEGFLIKQRKTHSKS